MRLFLVFALLSCGPAVHAQNATTRTARPLPPAQFFVGTIQSIDEKKKTISIRDKSLGVERTLSFDLKNCRLTSGFVNNLQNEQRRPKFPRPQGKLYVLPNPEKRIPSVALGRIDFKKLKVGQSVEVSVRLFKSPVANKGNQKKEAVQINGFADFLAILPQALPTPLPPKKVK